MVLVKPRTMSKSNSNINEATADDTAVGAELAECVVCGAVGLPERINNYDCKVFLTNRTEVADQ